MKRVMMPIETPDGRYCFGGPANANGITEICNQFDNEGGHPTCDLKFSVEAVPEGCKKSILCNGLPSIKEGT